MCLIQQKGGNHGGMKLLTNRKKKAIAQIALWSDIFMINHLSLFRARLIA